MPNTTISTLMATPPTITSPPAAVPAPKTSPARQADAHPFAELLHHNRVAANAPAPARPAPKDPAGTSRDREPTAAPGTDGGARTHAARVEQRRRDAKAPGHPHEHRPDQKPSGRPSGEPDAAPKAASATDSHDHDLAGPVADPALAQWLAELNLAQDPKADTDAAADDAVSSTARPAALGAPDGKSRNDLAVRADGRASASPGTARTPQADAFALVAAESSRPDTVTHAAPAADAAPTALSGLAAASPGAASPSIGAPVDVSLPMPVDAPDFAHALGVQMSVLAKDGVHHAELHLNPADLGPVSVRITMDGTQARIDFGADAAATRHAIEAGMPELASALRDAGFTLSGGGVSHHARGGDGQPGGGDGRATQGDRGTADSIEPDGAPPRAQRVTLSGAVDLYA